ncbi:MAG: HlyD family efflux transporter periplasmic adaptor subunit [Candidatus Omnitrophica bacterium]|nr:HlyD family efflux transporter periplasmic adaptor subunit [Candidatus Omnitrophota bacterium]
MWNKKIKIILVLSGIILLLFFVLRLAQKKPSQEEVKEITPKRGLIQSIISTTATVLPKNRLEIKPPVNGRVEEILVQEGQKVKTGDIIAWMSSTERAALIDAARGKGEETLKYWQDTYKPIPLVAPIDAEVIVATTQPGQTITASDAVIVLSDHLIARAQVDETDIGKIKQGQQAIISLDAYSDTKIKGMVEHIYYESKTVNNVTIYEVDVIPEEIPLFFRSGMNASIDFIEESQDNVLLLPQEAVKKEEKTKAYVLVKQNNGKEPLRCEVKLGISDEKNVEILSGIKDTDTVIVRSKRYSIPTTDTGTNPFMPGRR